ncbi:hypothetical protein HK096_006454, partial [Nowakowskiella sp. JEL0078]
AVKDYAPDNFRFYVALSNLENYMQREIPGYVRPVLEGRGYFEGGKTLPSTNNIIPPTRAIQRFMLATHTFPTGVSQVVPPRRTNRSQSFSKNRSERSPSVSSVTSSSVASSSVGSSTVASSTVAPSTVASSAVTPLSASPASPTFSLLSNFDNMMLKRTRSRSFGTTLASIDDDFTIPLDNIEEFMAFYHQFVAQGAPYAATIPASLRQRVQQTLLSAGAATSDNAVYVSVFDGVIDEVFAVIYHDAFARWIVARRRSNEFNRIFRNSGSPVLGPTYSSELIPSIDINGTKYSNDNHGWSIDKCGSHSPIPPDLKSDHEQSRSPSVTKKTRSLSDRELSLLKGEREGFQFRNDRSEISNGGESPDQNFESFFKSKGQDEIKKLPHLKISFRKKK